MRRTVLGPALAALGADQLRHLELHHFLRDGPDGLADHVGVLVEQHLLDDLPDRHPVGTGHRWRLISSTAWNEPTIMSAAWPGSRPSPQPRDRPEISRA
jgi:hypothetical protein